MKPIYISKYIDDQASLIFGQLMNLDWLQVTDARKEYFMSLIGELKYTYGKGINARTYDSKPFTNSVNAIRHLLRIDGYGKDYNVCFLNRYENEKNQLGWHADDSPEMNPDHPIAVISFGAEREIYWKHKDYKDVIPPEQRQVLEDGSLFIMPAGFQAEHLHKIPKSDKPCGVRISLTFRNYK